MSPDAPERLYYDGDCGLCHRVVTFVLARDPHGVAFRFAPLGGETFRRRVPEAARAGLADSIVVERAGDGALLERSDAVVHVLLRLGGGWELLGRALGRLPRAVRDVAYDFVAGRRGRLFRAPASVCPLVPPHLRARFES